MPYIGQIATIPTAQGSLNSDDNYTVRPATDLLEAEGVVFEGGMWRKEPGATAFDAGISGSPAIVAVYDWRPTASVQRVVTACSDGKLYKEVTGDVDSVTLVSGLSTSARGRFVPGGIEDAGRNRKLFYFNGTNAVQVLSGDGVTAAGLTNPPADWSSTNQPINGVIHSSRLWGFGNLNDPHHIYASGPDDHEDFLCAKAWDGQVYTGTGERLVCAASINKQLYLWKYPKGIFVLDDSNYNKEYWTIQQIAEDIGVAQTPYAVVPLMGDAVFLSADGGFHILSLAATGPRASDLGDKLRIKTWLRDNLNLSRLNQAVSVLYEHKSLVMFMLPGVGSATNNLRLMFDFSQIGTTGKILVSYSKRDVTDSVCLRRSADTIERPMIGTNAGYVWLLDQSARTKAGGYLGQVRHAETDFSEGDAANASVKKLYDFLELVCDPLGTCVLTAEVFIDGTLTRTLTFDGNRRRHVKRLGCEGRRISVRVRNAIDNQDFALAAIRVWFRPGDEDEQ